MSVEQQEEGNSEQTIEQQAEAGTLGLFAEDSEGDDDGLQGQKEGQEEKGRQEGQVEQNPRLSAAMEEIARRDREVYEKTKALKELQAQQQQYTQLHELSKNDPDQVLKAYGIDPAEYVYQKYLAGDDDKKAEPKELDPHVSALQQEVQALKAEKAAEQYDGQYQKGIGALQYQAEQMQEDVPLAARVLAGNGAKVLGDQMLQAASQRYQQYGQVPSVQDLVTHVEPVLLDQSLGVVRELWAVEKYRDQILEIIGQKDSGRKPPAPQQHKRSETLSSKMGGEKAAPDSRAMSDEEREAEFIRLMRKDGWAEEDE